MRANRGKGWEARLDHQHTLYRKAATAVVFKCHPEVKLIAGRPVRQKGPPDYVGRAGDLPVCFDAKETTGTRWDFANLKRHQAVSLEGYADDPRAIVGIALRMKGTGTWWLDWSVLGPMWWDTDGRRSVDAAWLDLNARRMDGADWLAVVP